MPNMPPPLPRPHSPMPAPTIVYRGSLGKDIGLLLIRLALGAVFVYAGARKLFGEPSPTSGMKSFIETVETIDIIPKDMATAAAWAAAISEFACGILIGIGLLTRLFVLPLVATMAVASYMVAPNYAYMQVPMAAGVICLALVFTGPGRASLDGAIFRR